MVVGIDDNSVNRCRRNKWVISNYCPRSHVAAAVRRFPYPAANRPYVRHDAAIDRSSWIDRNSVDSALGGGVIETVKAAGHPFGLRTEGGEIGRAERVWVRKIKLQMLPRRNTARHACVLNSGRAYPRRVKAAGRKRQAMKPVFFQPRQTFSFFPRICAGYRHVTLRLRSRLHWALFTGEYSKRYPGQSKSQSE